MEVKILKKESNLVEFELPGEDHSLPNLIVKLALKRPEVDYAAYNIPHPLVGSPRIVVRVKEGEPLDVVRSIIEEIIALSREFREKVEEALKE